MATPKTDTPATGPDTTAWQTAGRNVRFHMSQDILFIAVPISAAVLASAPNSKSGKSKSVGSTEGNVSLPGSAIKFGVNVYTPTAN